jgi:Putative DNA-binding domain
MLRLRELQLRLSAALAAGPKDTGVVADAVDPALLALVSDHGDLTPSQRLDIYADMYRARLVDVLREDYPRVLAILGDEEFQALACRYLLQHPSTHPSVRYVGRRFADFLGGEPGGRLFLGDLARLEWARVEVFDAPDADPLRLSDLESLPASDWPTLRLRPIPACLVVECAWPAHEIWAAAEEPVPGLAGVGRPEASTIRVWREGWSVSHAAMGDLERRVFPLLERGESFARLCAAAEGGLEPEAAARAVGSLLMRWLEDGLLARLPA